MGPDMEATLRIYLGWELEPVLFEVSKDARFKQRVKYWMHMEGLFFQKLARMAIHQLKSSSPAGGICLKSFLLSSFSQHVIRSSMSHAHISSAPLFHR